VQLHAVVFDLLYTLVHPGEFPGGADRNAWLSEILGVPESALEDEWQTFEPLLESGRAATSKGLGPELSWVHAVASRHGVTVTELMQAQIDRDWDLTRRAALLDPPGSSIEGLAALRAQGMKIGVLSNTHALEMRAWPKSPLADLVDTMVFSHQVKAVKPDPKAYAAPLRQLGVRAGAAVYVGDGSSDELVGARKAGFAVVVLAAQAALNVAPSKVAELRGQADATVTSLAELPALITEFRGQRQPEQERAVGAAAGGHNDVSRAAGDEDRAL
jgi:putative hydrolase of the HAD superfamily